MRKTATMPAEIVPIRPPRTYTIHITHAADGRIVVVIPELADDARTRRCVVEVLKAAIEEIERGTL